MRESAGEVVKLPVARRKRSKPKKLSLDPLADPRSLPCAPSQVAEFRFATATLKARASPVEQITKGIDARADLQSVEPSPEWQSPPAKRIRGSDDGPASIADPRPTHTNAGKVLSFSSPGPVNGRRWRPPGMQTRDLRLLKTPKTATVVSTPLAIW